MLLLLFVEFARDDVRLVILQPQTMQQRNQSRTAFVNEAEFLFDKGADLARRARHVAPTKAFNASSCSALKSRAPAHVEAGQALDPRRRSNSLNQPRIVSSFNKNASATS